MDFKIFRDKEMKQEISELIDLGKVKAGEKKRFEFYVLNASIHPYEEMRFTADDPEIKILSHPKQLDVKASGIVTLEWTPSVDIQAGLKTRLEIFGYKLIG